MQLYELNRETEKAFSQYLSLFDDNGEQTGTDEEVSLAYAALKELENRKDELAEWALKKRANALGNVASVEAEIKRLSALAEKEAKVAERMEKIIAQFFPSESVTKPVLLGNFAVSYRASSAVEIIDVSLIPSEFMKTPKVPEPTADKIAIKAAINEGKEVPGARIEERKTLSIK